MKSEHYGIIAAAESIADHWESNIPQGQPEEERRLEDVLDLPNDSYSDYVNVAPTQMKGQKARTVNISFDGSPTTRTLFTREDKAPDLLKGTEAIGRGEFLVETQDAWVPT